jgi:hypothetical protein
MVNNLAGKSAVFPIWKASATSPFFSRQLHFRNLPYRAATVLLHCSEWLGISRDIIFGGSDGREYTALGAERGPDRIKRDDQVSRLLRGQERY